MPPSEVRAETAAVGEETRAHVYCLHCSLRWTAWNWLQVCVIQACCHSSVYIVHRDGRHETSYRCVCVFKICCHRSFKVCCHRSTRNSSLVVKGTAEMRTHTHMHTQTRALSIHAHTYTHTQTRCQGPAGSPSFFF